MYSRALLHLLEAEQSEEQLYQEISKVGLISAASTLCISATYRALIRVIVFTGQRYLHSLLGQQQEVDWKGEQPFFLFCFFFWAQCCPLHTTLQYCNAALRMLSSLKCLMSGLTPSGDESLDSPHQWQDRQGQQVCWLLLKMLYEAIQYCRFITSSTMVAQIKCFLSCNSTVLFNSDFR